MSTTVFTQLSETEIQAMFRQVLESFFADKEATITAQALPEIGGMDLAMEITGLKRPSIYGLTSTKAIPHYRQVSGSTSNDPSYSMDRSAAN